MNKNVLIIEDDKNIVSLEKDYLEANNFDSEAAYDGKTGLEMALTGNYDLVILDLMLPKVDGFEICRQIRKSMDIPIIIVSAKKEDFDKIKGLGLGADDYMTKPFQPSELVARVAAHISRYERLTKGKDANNIIAIGNLEIDQKAHRVFVSGEEVIFTNKEFELLVHFALNPNIVFSKDDIFNKIWGLDSMGETSTVTVHVNRVRDKIKEIDPKFVSIETIWGSGYRFKA